MTDFARARTVMVDTQVRPSDVTKFPVIAAMLAIPREVFVPAARRDVAYTGENLDIGGNRFLLDPRTLAKMIDELSIQPGDLVLDLGCGLGYSTAVLARIAEAVVGVEENADMARQAQENLTAEAVDNAAVIAGPLVEGAAKQGPFDAILIEGGVNIIPERLIAQLRPGGRIAAIFREGSLGVVRIGYFIDGRMNWRYAFNATAPVLPGFSEPAGFSL
ncbi:protein-L-isoaspartate O-methyltransferase family protein [Paracoccus pacificus]|uniref:Protein-L-isoaspartate O-methyltransferase n=1 Tax=Paracoccus pacificus TaxID=1463598 RepID=A0ABW4RC25_9RHOB